MRRILLLHRAALLSLMALTGMLTFTAPASAQAWCVATFSCRFGYNPYCWARIFSGGYSQVIRIPAGRSVRQYGLRPGATYCSWSGRVPGYGCPRQRVRMVCAHR